MDEKEKNGDIPPKIRVHPYKKSNILSKLFFCWALPLFVKGYRKDLEEEDLYGPLKAHESQRLGDKIEKAWLTQRKPSLWIALGKVFGFDLFWYGLLLFIQEIIVKMAQPSLIGKLMAYYDPQQTDVGIDQAYMYVGGIIGVSLINVLILHTYFFGLQHMGMKIKVALSSLIYRKALKLNKSALGETTVGQMVNLLANDVSRFDFLSIHIHYLVIAPLETIVVVYLIYSTVDPAALAGVAILFAFVPLQIYLARKTSFYRFRTAIKTDQRVRLMNEIISGIQVIKMYAWEKPFAKLIELVRKYEVRQIKANSYLKAINLSFIIFLSRVSMYLCVLTYVVTGNVLTAEYVYVVTSYYTILRQTLTMFLPRAINLLAESNVSVGRLEKFLSYEEVEEVPTATMQNGKVDLKVGVSMSDVAVSWNKKQDDVLRDISLKAESGQLIGVVGPVGSGKSTLLHIILREIDLTNGSLEISGKISYAAQEPWLFAASIRQNILFGEPLDAERYQEVVRVCALERDFSLFPYGDRTIVGERGVMLSGGQKARINLARAVYKKADIYLLDDPLSAVDAHVGKELFENCIADYLKDKCTILVTHQIQYLNNVDRIYLFENGTITSSGTYDELRSADSEFVSLLEEISSTEKEDKKEEPERKLKTLKSLEKGDKPVEIKEHKSTGTLSKRVYLKYLKAGGNYCVSILILLTFIIAQIGGSGFDVFITFWVNIEQERTAEQLFPNINNTNSESFTAWAATVLTPEICLYILSFMVGFVIFMSVLRSLSFFKICMKASKNLHNSMFANIVRAPMRFFNTNPSGRILNRFSKDMGSIDETLPQSILDTMQIGLQVLSTTIVLSSVNLWITIPTVVIFVLFYLYKTVFVATSRDLKRLEGTTRSPIFTHLSASLQGLSTIRAFNAQQTLKLEFDHFQDKNSAAMYMFLGASRTFAFWLDINCILYISLVILSFLFLGTETFGGNVGLAITQAITMTGMLQYGMRQWSELENQMTSVERVVEYTEIDQEADQPQTPQKTWPTEGKIDFRKVFMQYSSDDPYVLKNLSFTINPSEKIGIVGRTGAGKSSIISALFRLAPIEGHIIIDEVDTKKISLNALRSKISIIPQEPVLFCGTLRYNLDPFEDYSDDQLWNALDEVHLKDVIADLPSGLSSNVAEGGSNFSVGQRQLLCLARAVLRSNKILILDEATANVDPQTDELIQTTIRNKFKDCTVLTIAHRLNTIMDSDRILVMSAGQAVEFDHPHLLLQNSDSVFLGLVKQTSAGMVEHLMKIARDNFEQRQVAVVSN